MEVGAAGNSARLIVVGPRDSPVEARRIDDVGVGRVDGVVRALAAGRALEFLGGDLVAAPAEVDDAAEAAVVLHRPVDVERRRHVIVDVEELADGDVVPELTPVLALVVGNGHALVEAVEDVVRIVGVDPQGVVVPAGHAADAAKVLPPSFETLSGTPMM